EEEGREPPALGGAGERLEGLPRHLVAALRQAPDGRGVHALEEHAEGELPGGGVRGVERVRGRTGRERRRLRGQRSIGQQGGLGGGGRHADSWRGCRARSPRRAGSGRNGASGRPSPVRSTRRGVGVGATRSRARSAAESWAIVPRGTASRSSPTRRTSRTVPAPPVGASARAASIRAAS